MVAQTIGSLFFRVALGCGQRTALVSDEGECSYSELLGMAQGLARVLRDNGITPTCRVAVLAENNPVFVSAVLAVSLVGAVFVPLNTRWRICEMERALEDAKCVALIYSPKFAGVVQDIQADGYAPPLLVGEGAKLPGGCRSWADYAQQAEPDEGFTVGYPRPDAPGAILFTGGTTGKAKGALLSHASFVLDAVADSRDQLLYGPGSVFFSVAPLAHRAAFSYLVKILLSGGTFVMTSHFDARSFLETVQRYGVTAAFVIPAPFIYKLEDKARAWHQTFPSVQVVMLGGTDVSIDELRATWHVFPNACVQRGYSHTENAAHTVERIYEADFDGASFNPRGIGRPRLYTSLKLCDDQGREVPLGQIGEAYATAPWQMLGYESQPGPTDGWIRTGDLLRKYPDGTFSFEGRVKELIKTGGELVFCAEVEDIVSSMPEVKRCAAFGRDDNTYGEIVCVAVVPESGQEVTLEAVQAFCAPRIAGFKKPRVLDVVEEIPTTNTGKVDRLALAKRASSHVKHGPHTNA